MKKKFIDITFPTAFDISKYENKRILIVGAGPTTNLVNWQNIEYDYVFSCNQYFECDKLNNVTVDITSLINRILKTSDSDKLQNRLDTDNSYIGIEPYHSSMVFNDEVYKKFITKYKDKCIFFDTNFQNKSGAAPRLAILAAALKPKTIYMVGIDGYANLKNASHSFDKNLIGIRDGNSYESVNNAHKDFAIYIHKLCTSLNIKLFNLSEDYSENIMSNYSKINFPLPKELKNRLI